MVITDGKPVVFVLRYMRYLDKGESLVQYFTEDGSGGGKDEDEDEEAVRVMRIEIRPRRINGRDSREGGQGGMRKNNRTLNLALHERG